MTESQHHTSALSFQYVLFSTSEDVRDTLTSLRSDLDARQFFTCPSDMWELVLAEVLNNIVEHAYGDRPDGEILFSVDIDQRTLKACFIDKGASMPEGVLPIGTPASVDVEKQLLPEGGFGWFLIQSLSDHLIYERCGHENHLKLEMRLQGMANL